VKSRFFNSDGIYFDFSWAARSALRVNTFIRRELEATRLGSGPRPITSGVE